MFLERKAFAAQPLPYRTARWLWGAVALNVITLSVMLAVGDRLDRAGTIGALTTLGSHHVWVIALAGAALLGLVVLAPFTAGFSTATGWQRGLLAVAFLCTVVATATALAVAVVIMIVLALVVLVLR